MPERPPSPCAEQTTPLREIGRLPAPRLYSTTAGPYRLDRGNERTGGLGWGKYPTSNLTPALYVVFLRAGTAIEEWRYTHALCCTAGATDRPLPTKSRVLVILALVLLVSPAAPLEEIDCVIDESQNPHTTHDNHRPVTKSQVN